MTLKDYDNRKKFLFSDHKFTIYKMKNFNIIPKISILIEFEVNYDE